MKASTICGITVGILALYMGLACLFATGQSVSNPAPVAMFRNSLDHSGVYPDSSSGIYGGVSWRKQTGGAVRSSPTVADGVVFIGSSDGNLYALDANTGHEKWKFSADSAVASSAAVASGLVFLSSYKGTFYAVNFADGRLLWKTQFGADAPRGKPGTTRRPTMAISFCRPRRFSTTRSLWVGVTGSCMRST
jgi:outer membrane protein assembly factor BamB